MGRLLLCGHMVRCVRGFFFLCFTFRFFFEGSKMPTSFHPTIPAAYRSSLGVAMQKPQGFVVGVSNAIKRLFASEWAEMKAKQPGKKKRGEDGNEDGEGAKRDRESDVEVHGSKKQKHREVIWRDGSDIAVYNWGDKKVFMSPQWGVTGFHVRYRDKVHGWLHFKCVGPGRVKVWKHSDEVEPDTTHTYMKHALSSVLGSEVVTKGLRDRFMQRIRRAFAIGTGQSSGASENEESDEMHGSKRLTKQGRVSAASLPPTDFSLDEDIALIQVLQDACISGAAGTSLLVADCVELDFPKMWILFKIRSSSYVHERLRSRDCNSLCERFSQLLGLLKDEVLNAAVNDPTGRLVDFSFLHLQKRKYLD